MHKLILLLAGALVCLAGKEAFAKGQEPPRRTLQHEISSLSVPRLHATPRLSDFEGMAPATAVGKKMLNVHGFIQRDPKDGAEVSQRTEAYLGYTDKNFYVIFLAFDSEPKLMRARMLRREQIDDDDQVGLFLDTFHDHRHAYMFFTNPYGIQQDALFSEDNGPDLSFDTVWHTYTKFTGSGYMAEFEIPFRSLRFEPSASHTFGVLLSRVIPRNSERAYYPENSSRSQGWLVHEGDINGFQEISPGRNMQFIPYTSLGAFRALDERDPAGDRFTGKHLEPKAGLDSKIVIKDSLVFDSTINPDFGQIESDDPQVTVNQRFEVFFPEKRPFFQENSSYFDTPLNLVFTRRVVDPLYGARMTGKVGPWAIGTFVANDRAPGKSVIEGDPLFGNDAYFGVFRVNRELGKNNSIGFIFTDRELHTGGPDSFCTLSECQVGHNRVGGFDTRIKFNQNWVMSAQAVTSKTRFADGTREAGPAYNAFVQRSSRKMQLEFTYTDIAPGFSTETGFIPRTDLRKISNFTGYTLHPEGKVLTAHGVRMFEQALWDHNSNFLNYVVNPAYEWDFQRQSSINLFTILEHERLRPIDFSALPANRDYAHFGGGVAGNTQFFKWLNVNAQVDWGTVTNFVPPANTPPVLAYQNTASIRAVVRPAKGLTIENTYLMTRLLDQSTGLNIFNNHIIRSKWNYQFTKEFSLRVIPEYDAVIGNPAFTSLTNSKRFNGDVLFTYMVTPGTAIYAGYNSDLQNLDPSLQFGTDGNLLRTRSMFINDGRQIFIKLSYLFRY